MINVIRQGIKLYKKANNINNAERDDYPEILSKLFGVAISSEQLEGMSANKLLDILIREEF